MRWSIWSNSWRSNIGQDDNGLVPNRQAITPANSHQYFNFNHCDTRNSMCIVGNMVSQHWVQRLKDLCVCVCVCVWGGGGGGDSEINVLEEGWARAPDPCATGPSKWPWGNPGPETSVTVYMGILRPGTPATIVHNIVTYDARMRTWWEKLG